MVLDNSAENTEGNNTKENVTEGHIYMKKNTCDLRPQENINECKRIHGDVASFVFPHGQKFNQGLAKFVPFFSSSFIQVGSPTSEKIKIWTERGGELTIKTLRLVPTVGSTQFNSIQFNWNHHFEVKMLMEYFVFR